jgi:hypothetical protein
LLPLLLKLPSLLLKLLLLPLLKLLLLLLPLLLGKGPLADDWRRLWMISLSCFTTSILT